VVVGPALGTGVATPLPHTLEYAVSSSEIEASVACDDTEKPLPLLSAAYRATRAESC